MQHEHSLLTKAPPGKFHVFLDNAIQVSIYACAGTIILSIAIAQAAALLALIFWLVKIVVVQNYPYRASIIQLPFGVFILARLLSIPLSTVPEVSIDAFRTEIFFYGLFFVVLHEVKIERLQHVRSLILVLFGAGLLAAVYGIIMQLSGGVPRATSTTSGYYTLGMYLCTLLVLLFPLGSKSIIIKPKWMWLAGSGVLLVGLLLTYNRLHWAAAGVALTVGGLIYDRKAFIAFGVFGAIALFLLPDVSTRFGMMVNIGSHMSDRDLIWKGATMVWDQHPIVGFGLRTFREIFPLFEVVGDKGIGSWHNDFLQVYMESGFMGLLPFCWMLGTIIVTGLKKVRRMDSGDPMRYVLASLVLTMIPFVLAGFILDTLMHLFFFLVAGLIAALTTHPPEQVPVKSETKKRERIA